MGDRRDWAQQRSWRGSKPDEWARDRDDRGKGGGRRGDRYDREYDRDAGRGSRSDRYDRERDPRARDERHDGRRRYEGSAQDNRGRGRDDRGHGREMERRDGNWDRGRGRRPDSFEQRRRDDREDYGAAPWRNIRGGQDDRQRDRDYRGYDRDRRDFRERSRSRDRSRGRGRHFDHSGKETGHTDVIRVPLSVKGRIIGRRGAVIREIEEKSGANVRSDDVDELEADFTMRGSLEAVEEARRLINEILDKSAGEEIDADMAEELHSDSVRVPQSMMGLVIGKRGATIKEIEDKSGARVKSGDRTEHDCEFSIRGSIEAVEEAKQMINDIVDGTSTLVGDEPEEESDIPAEDVSDYLAVPRSMIGKIIGKKGAVIREIEDKSGAQIESHDLDDYECEFSMKGSQEAVDEAKRLIQNIMEKTDNPDEDKADKATEGHDESHSDYLRLPRSLVPKIIGKKGAVIKEIKDKSGAKIATDDVDEYECEFTFIGTPEAVEEAKRLINEIVEQGDNKPTGREDPAVTEILRFPRHMLRRVVGRQGATIREIREQTGATVDAQDADEDHCEIYISGSAEAVEEAMTKVYDIHDQVEEERRKAADEVSESLEFPRSVLKRIIGSRGATIKDIRYKSGAQVEADDLNQSDCQVKIRGSAEAVAKAKDLVYELVGDVNVDALVFPRSLVGGIIGKRGANINEVRDKSGARIDVSDLNDEETQLKISGKKGDVEEAKLMINDIAEKIRNGDSATGDSVTESLEFPISKFGKILGSKGVNINDIRRKTGAKVNAEPYKETCSIQISGTPDQVDYAKELIARLTDEDSKPGPGARGRSSDTAGSNFDTLRLPRDIGSRVIGEHGATINDISQETGAAIDMEDLDEEMEFAISGTPQAVRRATARIQDIVDQCSSHPDDVNETLVFQLSVFRHFLEKTDQIKDVRRQTGARIVAKELDHDEKEIWISGQSAAVEEAKALLSEAVGDGVSDSFEIPRSSVGLILGKQGATIKSIQDRTGTHIDISDVNSDVSGVRITGRPRDVEDAKAKIKQFSESDGAADSNADYYDSGYSRKRRRTQPRDEAQTFDPSLFVCDLPGNMTSEDFISFHSDLGLTDNEKPTSVKFFPSRDEDCSTCIARYGRDVDEHKILGLLHGKVVAVQGGSRKLRAKIAKPAQWMREKSGHEHEDDSSGKHLELHVSQVPIEYTQADIEQLHTENGLDSDNWPALIKFLVNKNRETKTHNQEYCNCIIAYKDRESTLMACEKLLGCPVTNGAGAQTALGVCLVQAEEVVDGDDEPPLGKRVRATAIGWNEERGFGFVQLQQGGTDVFVHRDKLVGLTYLVPGTSVEIILGKDPNKPKKYAAVSCEASDVGQFSSKNYSEHVEITPIPNSKPKKALRHDFFGFEEFCQLWGVSDATAAWLSGLPESVLRPIIDYFSGAVFDLGNILKKGLVIRPIRNVVTKPTDCVYVRGLPGDYTQDSLIKLFNLCGLVVGLKILGGVDARGRKSALVQMSSVSEAKLAVEDLNHMIPIGLSEPLLVRYRNVSEEAPTELAPGVAHQGVARLWNKEEQSGLIYAYGVWPEVLVQSSAVLDTTGLENGATTVFEAEWDEEKRQYCATKCYAHPDVVALHLRASSGNDKAIRDFARRTYKSQFFQPYEIEPPQRS